MKLETSICKNEIYSLQELALIDPCCLPAHIAIIMDGNRRWARQQKVPYVLGHWKGAETLTHIVKACSELKIKILTVYAFSTENWMRPKAEVDVLMDLFKVYLQEQKEEMVNNGVRLSTIGDLSRLSSELKQTLEESKEETRYGNAIQLVLAINYGGRDDIRRATHAILDDFSSGKIAKEDLSEELFSCYLDTAPWKDPDLLIRTSGEMRLSNFLLWQLSYAEVYTTDVLWPSFTKDDLLHAIIDYQRRERRLGGS